MDFPTHIDTLYTSNIRQRNPFWAYTGWRIYPASYLSEDKGIQDDGNRTITQPYVPYMTLTEKFFGNPRKFVLKHHPKEAVDMMIAHAKAKIYSFIDNYPID